MGTNTSPVTTLKTSFLLLRNLSGRRKSAAFDAFQIGRRFSCFRPNFYDQRSREPGNLPRADVLRRFVDRLAKRTYRVEHFSHDPVVPPEVVQALFGQLLDPKLDGRINGGLLRREPGPGSPIAGERAPRLFIFD